MVACLDRDQVTRLFIPIAGIFLVWHFEDFRGVYRSLPWLRYLGETAFTGLLAILVVAVMLLIRRRLWGDGELLIVSMAIGSSIGHLLLIQLLHLDMNPPRVDTWASNAGMVGAILFYCWRRRRGAVAFATLGGLLLGGIGFAAGGATKLLVMSSGYDTNWHSIMEQSQGWTRPGVHNGLSVGSHALRFPAHRSPPRLLWRFRRYQLCAGDFTHLYRRLTEHLIGGICGGARN